MSILDGDTQPLAVLSIPEDQLEAEFNSRAQVSLADLPRKPIYHYTTARGLLGILNTRQLRASDYRYLNDPREVIGGEEIVLKTIEEYAAANGASSTRAATAELARRLFSQNRISDQECLYIVSFSEEGDQLSQWDRYANAGRGYSIGFSVGVMTATELAPNFLAKAFRCDYDEVGLSTHVRTTLDLAAGILDDWTPKFAGQVEQMKRLAVRAVDVAMRIIFDRAICYKDRAYAEEKEWRLLVAHLSANKAAVRGFRHAETGVVPYLVVRLTDQLPLRITDIKAGPCGNKELRLEALRQVLDDSKEPLRKVLTPGVVPRDLATVSAIQYRG